jgi:hypothetical protein
LQPLARARAGDSACPFPIPFSPKGRSRKGEAFGFAIEEKGKIDAKIQKREAGRT